MLDSVKIQRRQSEIRQTLAELVGKEKPTDDETRQMESMDGEYRSNETRYRAALISEDSERKEAGRDLETRSGSEWADLLNRFEVRQAVQALAEDGRALTGQTAEVVAEMRSKGSYRGIPIPLEALEVRAGETVGGGVADPVKTMNIVDRLFADSVAVAMGGQVINIPSGQVEWPVVTSSISAAWSTTETGAVAAAAAFVTTDKAMVPNQNLGVQMKLTRRAMLQTGPALEQAVRRDLQSAIRVKLDQAAFQGTGADGQPLGVIVGAATYGITATDVSAAASYGAFRSAAVRFMTANAAGGPGAVRLLVRPEIFDSMDELISGLAISEWDRLTAKIGGVIVSSNALAAPTGSPDESSALLTVSSGGVAPFFAGIWGGVDLIRDVYSDASSGGVRLTGLLTADFTVARPAQLEVLTGLQ